MSKILGTASDLRVMIKLIRFSVCAIGAQLIIYVIGGAFTQMYQAASTGTQQELAGSLNVQQWSVAAALALSYAGAGLLIYWTIGAFWSTTSFIMRTMRTRGATQ